MLHKPDPGVTVTNEMADQADQTFPVRYSAKELQKPAKGTALMERKDRRKQIDSAEEKHKAEARKRDGKCRFPHCPNCKQYRDLVPQAAHVIAAKGQGGDPTLIRSQVDQLMLLDPITHGAQERHEIDVEPMTSLGTNGPCRFFLIEDVVNASTGEYGQARLLWEWETAPGVPAHPHPLIQRRPARKAKEHD